MQATVNWDQINVGVHLIGLVISYSFSRLSDMVLTLPYTQNFFLHLIKMMKLFQCHVNEGTRDIVKDALSICGIKHSVEQGKPLRAQRRVQSVSLND